MKFRITGIKSQEYSRGRFDSFLIPTNKDIHKEVISLLLDLGFSEKKALTFDFDFSETDGVFFIYNKGMRFYLILNEDNTRLVFDTKKPKKEIISVIKKYFRLLE